jgi:probable F420-dependent oxidoreductase
MLRKYRFGLAGAPFGIGVGPFESIRAWTDVARQAEDLGFATLLAPDGPKRFSVFQALAAAAVVTERLRLGTMVIPVPLRSPGVIAWETASLDQLSGGRFELGLGSGHPANAEGTEQLGVPYRTAGERIAMVGETIAAVNRLAADAPVQPAQQPRPPIMVAGSSERLLTLAAQQADIIHLGVHTEEALAHKVAVIREAAGNRFDDLELSISIFHIGGGEEPAWLRNYGIKPGVEHISAIRTDDTAAVIDKLHRWRDEYSISYFVIGPAAIAPATPVIAELAGS